MQELGERPFCRTLERKKEDEEENRKRQLEEDKEESEGKRAKIMPTIEGHENLDFLSPGKKATADQEEHDNKLKEQQKELIRSHKLTIQQQEESLIRQQRTIKFQQEIIDAMKQQQLTRAQEVKCSSSLSGVVPGTSGEGNVFPGQSFKMDGYGTIDNYLKPEALSFLHRAKQETPNIQEGDVVISEEIPEISTSRINVPVLPSQLQISEREQQEPAIQKNVYLPKQVPESQNLILVPARMKKTTTLQASTRPVPEELQDDRLHYCKKCEAKYTTRDELNCHVAKNCQVKEPEFFVISVTLLSFGLTLFVNITTRNILKSFCTTVANVIRDFTGSRGYRLITKNVQIEMVPINTKVDCLTIKKSKKNFRGKRLFL